MITLRLGRYQLGSLAIIALLTGCQAPQSQVAPTGAGLAIPGERVVVRSDHGASWMQVVPPGTTLLYVDDTTTNDVYVFNYATHAPVGTLTGFSNPQGECTDTHGNVFITNMGAGNVQEFAHGGTRVINTFDPGGTPMGCASDPTTNNLAVSDSGTGNYTLYLNEDPTHHAVYGPGTSGITSMYYLGYDSAGNLYMDGFVGAAFGWAESPTPNGPVVALPYSGPPIVTPGGVQWLANGPIRVLIGDQSTNKIYKIKINGFQAGVTITLGACVGSTVVQFVRKTNRIVGPDSTCGTADVYTFPAGAVVLPAINVATPVGSAISPP
jgi:hypothetical protein